MRYSFLKHNMSLAPEMAGKILPGVERVISLYYSEKEGALSCYIMEGETVSAYECRTDDNERTEALRGGKPGHKWLGADEIPLEIHPDAEEAPPGDQSPAAGETREAGHRRGPRLPARAGAACRYRCSPARRERRR